MEATFLKTIKFIQLMPSSVVAAMHYDDDTSTLRIIFTSGLIYDYLKVPKQVYQKMKNAKSKGTFLNKIIKEKYDYIKVEK